MPLKKTLLWLWTVEQQSKHCFFALFCGKLVSLSFSFTVISNITNYQKRNLLCAVSCRYYPLRVDNRRSTDMTVWWSEGYLPRIVSNICIWTSYNLANFILKCVYIRTKVLFLPCEWAIFYHLSIQIGVGMATIL